MHVMGAYQMVFTSMKTNVKYVTEQELHYCDIELCQVNSMLMNIL